MQFGLINIGSLLSFSSPYCSNILQAVSLPLDVIRPPALSLTYLIPGGRGPLLHPSHSLASFLLDALAPKLSSRYMQ